jgi:uncharacterized protein (TIGR00297 family)
MTSHFAIGALLAVLISAISYRARALTVSGAIAATAVGAIVFGLGGGPATGALMAFFVTGSALSRWRKGVKDAFGFEKSGRRDAGQVLANGGVTAVCLLLPTVFPAFSRERALMSAIAAIAAAAADTWATEIGSVVGGRPYRITTGKPEEPGVSGAVSVAGTAAAFAGAVLIAGFALPLGTRATAIVAASGFLGALCDSLLGATVQAQWRDPERSERWIERRDGTPERGVRYMNNDVVNGLATLAAAVLAGILGRAG